MPVPEELDRALKEYGSNRVSAVTIKYDEWMKATTLGVLHPRSAETKAVDLALKKYWENNRSHQALLDLKDRFEHMISVQRTAGRDWKRSDRNKPDRTGIGILSKLYDQILMAQSAHAMTLKQDRKAWAVANALEKAHRDALKTLFQDRSLAFKNEPWRSDLVSAVNTYSKPLAAVRPHFGGSGSGSALTTSASAASQLLRPAGVSAELGKIMSAAQLHTVCRYLGIAAEGLVQASTFVLNWATHPAQLLGNLVSLAIQSRDRRRFAREHCVFRSGYANEALNTVLRLLDRDTKVTSTNLVTNAASLVSSFFPPAIPAVVFLCMSDALAVVNISAFDQGVEGFTARLADMSERSKPVIEKAHQYIRLSKYCLSGTENMVGWQTILDKHGLIESVSRLLNTRSDQMGAIDDGLRIVRAA
jgi:hypothetical protein